MSELSDFLLSRIAEDEREADEVHREDCEHLPPEPTFPCNCGVPARVLAECATKRRLAGLHEPVRHPRDGTTSRDSGKPLHFGPICTECSGYDDPYIDQVPYPCSTIRAVTTVYASHPDYREEWR